MKVLAILLLCITIVGCSSTSVNYSNDFPLGLDKQKPVDIIIIIDEYIGWGQDFDADLINDVNEMCQVAGYKKRKGAVMTSSEYSLYLQTNNDGYAICFLYGHSEEYSNYLILSNKTNNLYLNVSVVNLNNKELEYHNEVKVSQSKTVGLLSSLGLGTALLLKDNKAKAVSIGVGLGGDLMSALLINKSQYKKLNIKALDILYPYFQ